MTRLKFGILGGVLAIVLGAGGAVLAQQSNVTNAVVIAALQAMGLFGDGYATGQVPTWSAAAQQYQPGTGSGGAITPTSVGVPASTCAAPAIYEQGATTTGVGFAATPSVSVAVAGNCTLTSTASVLTAFTRYVIAQGTITAAAPALDISTTWNNAGVTFEGIKINVTNTASAAASLPLEVQVGGTSVLKVNRSGTFTVVGGIVSANGGDVALSSGARLSWDTGTKLAVTAAGLINVVNSAATFGVQLNAGTAAPTFNNGTVAAGSRNAAMTLTLTGGNTGGTVTFGAPNWTNAPHCILGGGVNSAGAAELAESTSAITVAGMVANSTFTILCVGQIGS